MVPASGDPLTAAWFSVEFGDAIKDMPFREVSGISTEVAVLEQKASAYNGRSFTAYLPGRQTIGDITLKRYMTKDLTLWKWRKLVEEGKMTDARKNGTITAMDQEGKALAKWEVTNAWPSKVSGPMPNASSTEPAMEEMTIVCETLKRSQ
jgi:phage tail-like protein